MKLSELNPRYKTYQISVLKDGQTHDMGTMRKTIADNIFGGYEVLKTWFMEDHRITCVLIRRPEV